MVLLDQTFRPVVERVLIPIKNLKPALEGFKIVQLSDFHLLPLTQPSQVRRAVEIANSLKPDLTVLTGDYVYREIEAMQTLSPILEGLNARHGVFACLGNHDHWMGVEAIKAGLRSARLPVLVNRGVLLPVGKDSLYLAGLDDAWIGRPDLKSALQGAPDEVPVVLLAHEPDSADIYTSDGRISLQLSGHTHGGQIRLPGIGALLLPYLGHKYDMGLYQVKGMWLYTNRGIGVIFEPLRFNCRPEVSEFTLIGA
jgi:predicted MPP superfamily phosphohydrolase